MQAWFQELFHRCGSRCGEIILIFQLSVLLEQSLIEQARMTDRLAATLENISGAPIRTCVKLCTTAVVQHFQFDVRFTRKCT